MITIAATESGICHLSFNRQTIPNAEYAPCALTNTAATPVQEYLAGKRLDFDVPLDLTGSEFQRAVWEAVRTIPYGATCTPSDLARKLGRPDAHRSIGTALSKNPVALIIPDHRVVSSGGNPRGAGQAAQLKAALLALEHSRTFGQ